MEQSGQGSGISFIYVEPAHHRLILTQPQHEARTLQNVSSELNMSEKALLGFWFCLLLVFFPVPSGLASSFEPEECLVSGIYNLIRLPESKNETNCRQDCVAEADCHMAVVTRPLNGSEQCLLVNCLNRGKHSLLRDPSAQISVYLKFTLDGGRRKNLIRGSGYELVEETFRCHDDMTSYSGCRSGIPRFFYNTTSYRCERFFSGCGSSRNTFDTQEGCEALYRCYRPMDHGERPPFRFSIHSPSDEDTSVHNFIFYNVSSGRCEGFHFRGSASNGNIFRTVEECQSLCGDVKASADTVPTKNTAPTTSQPAVDSGVSAPVSRDTTVILSYVILVMFILLLLQFAVITVQYCRRRQYPSSISDQTQLILDEDE